MVTKEFFYKRERQMRNGGKADHLETTDNNSEVVNPIPTPNYNNTHCQVTESELRDMKMEESQIETSASLLKAKKQRWPYQRTSSSVQCATGIKMCLDFGASKGGAPVYLQMQCYHVPQRQYSMPRDSQCPFANHPSPDIEQGGPEIPF